MINFLLRTLWRLIIMLIGIGLVWCTVRLYPIANDRLPSLIILLLIYIVFAYGIIPALVRLLRVFIKPNLIPLYATTGDGWPSDPVNIALIVSNRAHLVRTMTRAGWYVADPQTLANGLRELISIVFNTPYPAAPLSGLYLFNRRHDIAFEIPTNDKASARTRHHVRFWRLEEPLVHHDAAHHHYFWLKRLRHLIVPEKEMWIGAATEDIRFVGVRWRNGQITHRVSHESDKERDFIISTLHSINAAKQIHSSKAGEEIRFRGQQIRTVYVSNGSIKIVSVR